MMSSSHPFIITKDGSRPFGIPWMDSCYQETLLPGSMWQPVQDTLCKALAERVRKQLSNVDRRQVMFSLLGENFVKQFFSDLSNNPMLLEPPQMSAENKKQLLTDAQRYLQNTLQKIILETGCVTPTMAVKAGGQMSEECTEFCQATHSRYHMGLQRFLYHQEQHVLKHLNDIERSEKAALEKQAEYDDIPALSGHTPSLKSILKKIPADPSVSDDTRRGSLSTLISSVSSGKSTRPYTANIKGVINKMRSDPPTFWGVQSNGLGRCMVAILTRDPRRFNDIAAKLHGRQLPASLRTFIWMDGLYRKERQQTQSNPEKFVRERFAKGVSHGMNDLRCRATHCPISGLIDNAVIELYDQTPCTQLYIDDNSHMKSTAKSLNVLYTYSRVYDPYLVYWLFPLQLATQQNEGQSEYVYDLAMYLDLLRTSCFPTWPQIFATANDTMVKLKELDPQLYHHVHNVADINYKGIPKDFMLEMIHNEELASKPPEPEVKGRSKKKQPKNLHESGQKMMSDPRLFLRKWIGEGFVSILDTQAVLWAWDQCFLQRWDTQVLQDLALVILLLLRYKLMKAQDYTDLKQILLEEPCKLYTLDIIRSWMHIQTERDPLEVPDMNRQIPSTPVVSPVPSLSSIESDVTSITPQKIGPVGLKNIRMELNFKPEAENTSWYTEDIKGAQLQLTCALYCGDSCVQSHTTEYPGADRNVLPVKRTRDLYRKKVRVEYRHDNIIFDAFDPTDYNIENHLEAKPYVLITVKCKPNVTTSEDYQPDVNEVDEVLPIGWAKVPLYERRRTTAHGSQRSKVGSRQGSIGAQETSKSPKSNQGSQRSNQGSQRSNQGSQRANEGSLKPPTPHNRAVSQASTHSVINLLDGDAQYVVHAGENSQTNAEDSEISQNNDWFDPDSYIRAFIFDPLTEAQTPPLSTTPAATIVTPASVPSPKPPTASPASTPQSTVEEPGISDPFDFYIDSVQNIPDNASVTKVTGRFYNVPPHVKIRDILAFPGLDESARSPGYKYRLQVNKDRAQMLPNMLLFLRVYSVDVNTRELSVIGSCLFKIFDNNSQVRLGTHRRRLHLGVPSTTDDLSELSLDSHTSPPACAVHFRLAPNNNSYQPPLATASYDGDTEWNESEKRVIYSYDNDTYFPKTVKEMSDYLLEDVKTGPKPANDTELEEWIVKRLEKPANTPVGDLDLYGAVHYRSKKGYYFKIREAYGISGDDYIQCFSRIVPGKTAKKLPVTAEGIGKEEKVVTLEHDYDALQSHPTWTDKTVLFRPHWDLYTVMAIQVYAMKFRYVPSKDNKERGTVVDSDGLPASLGPDAWLGWTILPLFDGLSLYQGIHHLPLFKKKPSSGIMKLLAEQRVPNVLQKVVEDNPDLVQPGVGLVVEIRDGHFNVDHLPTPMKINRSLQRLVVSDIDIYKSADELNEGEKLWHRVLKVLDKKYHKLGKNSDPFKREMEWYSEMFKSTFYNLMEDLMIEIGYGPL